MGRRKKIIPPPPPPTPAPKRTTFYAQHGLEENRTLLGSQGQLDIGDVFYRIEKCSVTRIVMTEGSKDLEVTYKITKSHWQKDL